MQFLELWNPLLCSVLIVTFETANGFTEKLQESFIKRQKIEVRSDIKTVSKRNVRA